MVQLVGDCGRAVVTQQRAERPLSVDSVVSGRRASALCTFRPGLRCSATIFGLDIYPLRISRCVYMSCGRAWTESLDDIEDEAGRTRTTMKDLKQSLLGLLCSPMIAVMVVIVTAYVVTWLEDEPDFGYGK